MSSKPTTILHFQAEYTIFTAFAFPLFLYCDAIIILLVLCVLSDNIGFGFQSNPHQRNEADLARFCEISAAFLPTLPSSLSFSSVSVQFVRNIRRARTLSTLKKANRTRFRSL